MVLCSLKLPHPFYTLMYLEVIAVLHYNRIFLKENVRYLVLICKDPI